MKKFIFCTFAFLAWGFYEMSGGSNFEPGAAIEARQMADADTTQSEQERFEARGTEAMLTQVVASAAAADTVAPQDVKSAAPARRPSAELLAKVDEVALTRRDTEIAAARAPAPAKVTRTSDMDTGPTRDVRRVDGDIVNMRTGPGTSYSVVDQLRQGDAVEVLRSEGGWLKLRVHDTIWIGWMADFLVTASAE